MPERRLADWTVVGPMDPERVPPEDRLSIQGRPMLSVAGAAMVLGVHVSRVYQLLRAGRLRGQKRSRWTYIPLADVMAYRKRRDWWIGLHTPKGRAAAPARQAG